MAVGCDGLPRVTLRWIEPFQGARGVLRGPGGQGVGAGRLWGRLGLEVPEAVRRKGVVLGWSAL